MRDILKPALVLLAICTGVTILLALVFNGTKPIIAQRAAADLAAAKLEVLPGADTFKDIEVPGALTASDEALGTVKSVAYGTKAGIFAGIVVTVLSKGYDAAGVSLTIGVDKEGSVAGIHVGDNKETPGLGTKALDANDTYLQQYENLKPSGDLTLVKNKAAGDVPEKIDAVAGVTFTSRAVLRGVQGALETFHRLTPEGGLK